MDEPLSIPQGALCIQSGLLNLVVDQVDAGLVSLDEFRQMVRLATGAEPRGREQRR